MKNPIFPYEAPSTNRLAIIHGVDHFPFKEHGRVPSRQTKIATAIQEIFEPKTLVVEANHTIADIERIFGIMGLGQSLLLGAKSLVGKTLVHHNGKIHIQESGTKFAVRSIANHEQVIVTEQIDIASTIQGTLGKFAELIERGNQIAANDGRYLRAA